MPIEKLTREGLEAKINGVTYSVHAGRMTLAVLELKNGFLIVGQSASLSVENYDKALGEHFAYEDGVKKLWDLEGYLARENQYQATK